MRHRPLFVWVLAFALGIGVAGMRPAPGLALAGAAVGALLLLAAGRRWWLAAAGIALTGVAAGALRLAVYQQVAGDDVSRWADRVAPVTLTGVVATDPQARLGGRLTLQLRAESVAARGHLRPASGEAYVALGPLALPAGGSLPDFGDRLVLRGRLEAPPGATNPGGFSWRDYLARRGVRTQMRVMRPGGAQEAGTGGANPWLRLAWGARRRWLRAVRSSLSPTQAALLSGILIGQRTDLPPDLMADFVSTGTVHILASAGLHVGIIAWWLLFLCERLTLPRKVSAALIILLLWTYTLMAGGRPAVTRAVVMATVYFGAILFERDPDLPTSLAAAALVVLWLQPTALWEAGFQLSFLTVATLALGMPVWEGFWRPRVLGHLERPGARQAALWGLEMAGLALLAQLGSAPIVAASYNQVSLSGWIANLLVVPSLFLIVPLGFAGAFLGALWQAGGAALLGLAGVGLGYVTLVVRGLGEAVWASRAVATPSPPVVVCYYALIGALMYVVARREARSTQMEASE